MDSQKINRLLDQSCANALDDWAQGKRIDRREASKAMRTLQDELKGFKKPDYDNEYIPPAYVINYQLGHIYMAWKALSWLREETSLGTIHRDSIRIVDFGAGTCVGRIGAALMAAEIIEGGNNIECIFFEEIDTSPRMLGMGNVVWRAFINEVQRSYAGTALEQAVRIIKSTQDKDWENIKGNDRDTWLTGFHVTYGAQDLQETIQKLCHRCEPIAGVFTCNRANMDMMRKLFPFPPVGEWSSGYFPPHKGKKDGKVKCETFYTMWQALRFGFRAAYQLEWRPFLQVKDCTILIGTTSRDRYIPL